ncbi:restriction endonuclease subunit S [Empedobacter brevis]|uniref:restriction endonuclease subunit S n=1 Tax=Empedobacter brevis TaxID=247 RepID=UPI0028AB7824|nr:restriction endonuclease subunit S [Empedobacter brevis]
MKISWSKVKFGDVFKLSSGVNLTVKKIVEGDYPVYGGNGIMGYHNEYNFSGDYIIIGRVGALCGNVRYVSGDFWLTDNAFRIDDYKADFDKKYLEYYLNHLNLRKYAREAVHPVISNSSLKSIELSFPELLSEQQQIVEKLDQAFEMIDQAKANIEQNIINTKELFQSKLNEAFSHKGEGWESDLLGNLVSIRPPKKEVKDKCEDSDNVTFLPMEDLGIDQKYVVPKKVRTLAEVYKGYTYFSEGDLLVAKITPCFENGKMGIAKDLCNSIGFGSSEYIVLRSKKDVMSEIVYYNLLQDRFREIGKNNMQGAVGHKRVTIEYVENFDISFPIERDLQKTLVENLSSLSMEKDSLIDKYQQKLENLEELRKSILEKAFRGELTY